MLIRKGSIKVGKQKSLSELLSVSETMITNYKYERASLSVEKVKILSNLLSIPLFEIDKYVIEIRDKDWNRRRIARKGGLKSSYSLRKKFGDNYFSMWGRKYGRVGGLTTLKKYGKAKLLEQARRAGKIGGKRRAEIYPREILSEWGKRGMEQVGPGIRKLAVEKAKPTHQVIKLIRANKRMGLSFQDFKVHYTIEFDDRFYNIDLAYFKNSELMLLEEASKVKNRQFAFAKIVRLLEIKRKLNERGENPFFSLTISNSNGKKFPLDSILYLVDNSIIPLFSDGSFSNQRSEIILSILRDEDPRKTLQGYFALLKKYCKKEIKKDKPRVRKILKSQCSVMSKNEILVHEMLKKIGLKPEGHVILETIYGSFLVPDNFFHYKGDDWYVFIQSPRSMKYDTVRAHFCKCLSNCFIVKNLVNKNAKCMVIIFCDNSVKIGKHMFVGLLKKFSSLILINPSIQKLKSFLSGGS